MTERERERGKDGEGGRDEGRERESEFCPQGRESNNSNNITFTYQT
jgi:hypothetical protein